jgi:hypothetical protein
VLSYQCSCSPPGSLLHPALIPSAICLGIVSRWIPLRQLVSHVGVQRGQFRDKSAKLQPEECTLRNLCFRCFKTCGHACSHMLQTLMLERVTLQYSYNILPTTNYASWVLLGLIDVASVDKCHPNKIVWQFQPSFANFYVSSTHSTLIVIS